MEAVTSHFFGLSNTYSYIKALTSTWSVYGATGKKTPARYLPWTKYFIYCTCHLM